MRRWRRMVWLVPVLLLSMATTTAWLLWIESGLQTVVVWLQWQSGGAIRLSDVRGQLAGPVQIGKLQLHTARVRVELENVQLHWQPALLWRRTLWLDQLQVQRLAFAQRADDAASTAPTDLRLPLSVHVAALTVAKVDRYSSLDFTDEPQGLAEQVVGNADSDGRQHKLRLRAKRGKQQWALTGQLDGQAPFALQATLHGTLVTASGSLQVQLDASDTLSAMRLQGAVLGAGQRVELACQLTPWQPLLVQSLRANADQFDVASFFSDAPHTALNITLHADVPATARGPLQLRGQVQIDNERSGTIDQQLLPLRAAQAELLATADRIELSALRLQLGTDSNANTGTGRMRWQDEQLTVDLQLAELDLAQLHRGLQTLTVAGEVHAELGADSQQFTAALHSQGMQLAIEARQHQGRLQIPRAELRGEAGRLQLNGALSLRDEYAFQGHVRATDLRLHRLLRVPETRFSANATVTGALQPALQMQLNYQLSDGWFAGRPLTGNGTLNWLPPERIRADAQLVIGNSRLNARGAFGQPGDRLVFTAVGTNMRLPFLQGSASVSGELRGSWQQPEGEFQLQVPALGDNAHWQVRDVRGNGRFSLRPGAPLQLDVALGGLDWRGRSLSGAATAQLSGTVGAHQLTLVSAQADGEASVSLRGGWRQAQWRGQLEQLSLPGRVPVQLLGPAPLQWDQTQQQFGPALLTAGEGQLQIEQLQHRAEKNGTAEWRSRGALRDWPVQRALPEPMRSSDLRISGHWDLRFANEWFGTLSVERQSGDLRWRNGSDVALGLQALRADVYRDKQMLVLNAHGAGERLGRVDARLHYPSAALQALDPNAPLTGQISASLPDVAWLGPLLSSSFVTGGKVQAEWQLAGTASQPELVGELRGEALAFASLGTGLQLADGQLRIGMRGQQAVVHELRFRDVADTPPPRAELAELVSSKFNGGGITGSGTIDWAERRADLQLQLDRLGVLQLPNQWVRLSGTAVGRYVAGAASIRGNLRADGGALQLAARGRPALSDDVVIVGDAPRERSTLLSVELDADLGERFYFSGSGLDARLKGRLRFHATPGNPLRATGVIETVDGVFDAYGQRLAIERGRVNFAGLIDNPGLDVLAMRRNQPVPAGVAVTGTVLQPQVELVSEPPLPEADKLSWLVLGKSVNDVGPGDPSLLMTAGRALFGDKGGGTLSRIQQQLGITVGLRTGSLGGTGVRSRSRIIDYSNNGNAAAAEIATIAKAVATGITIGFEQVVGTGESVVLLSWALSRQLNLEARSGDDNTLDLFYTLQFGQ